MHRALSDGELTWDGGKYPCNHVVLGGELLYTDDDYIMSLKNPSQVRDISNAIEKIDIDDFRNKYFKIDLNLQKRISNILGIGSKMFGNFINERQIIIDLCFSPQINKIR